LRLSYPFIQESIFFEMKVYYRQNGQPTMYMPGFVGIYMILDKNSTWTCFLAISKKSPS
jgi:hypothetical protein